MARTGHPNFVYEIASPWRTGLHIWSLTGNHSGGSFSGGDVTAFMEGVTSPFALSFAPFIAGPDTGGDPPLSFVTRWAYYDGSASAPVGEKTYLAADDTPDPLKPTGAAFGSTGRGNEALETCVLLYAKVGLNRLNKPNFVRKYVHCVPTNNLLLGGGNTKLEWNFEPAAATAVATLGNGNWYGSRVYCSPSGGQADSTGWQIEPFPGNHQMPRGRKRKVSGVTLSSKSGSDLLDSLLDGSPDLA